MLRYLSIPALLAATALACAGSNALAAGAPAGGAPAAGATDEGPVFLNGPWVGKGHAIRDKDITDCPFVSTAFEVRDNLYRIVSFTRACMEPGADGQAALKQQDFPPVTVAAKDGKILDQNGRQVGSYTADEVDIRYVVPMANLVRVWHTKLVRKGAVVLSEEDDSFIPANAGEPTYMLVYTGLLTKAAPADEPHS